MVLKTPAISSEMAARMSAESARQFSGDAKTKEIHDQTIMRMWCIEQAVAMNPPRAVDTAREIFLFVTGDK